MIRIWKSIAANENRCGRRSLAGGLCAIAMVVALLMPALRAGAQNVSNFDTGTITGTITDPSGAVVPHASVTVTNTGTGLVTKTETNGDGIFSAPGLQFGNYVVTASASSFQMTTTKPFALNVGATVRVDLKLSMAVATENVTVTGTATSVNTTSATAGTTLNTEQIRNLPTNGRDVAGLGFGPQQAQIEDFQQGDIAPGKPVARAVRGQ